MMVVVYYFFLYTNIQIYKVLTVGTGHGKLPIGTDDASGFGGAASTASSATGGSWWYRWYW